MDTNSHETPVTQVSSRTVHDLRNLAQAHGLLTQEMRDLQRAFSLQIAQAETQRTVDFGIRKWISERTPDHKTIVSVLTQREAKTGLDALLWIHGLIQDNSFEATKSECKYMNNAGTIQSFEVYDRRDTLICSGSYERCCDVLRALIVGDEWRYEAELTSEIYRLAKEYSAKIDDSLDVEISLNGETRVTNRRDQVLFDASSPELAYAWLAKEVGA